MLILCLIGAVFAVAFAVPDVVLQSSVTWGDANVGLQYSMGQSSLPYISPIDHRLLQCASIAHSFIHPM
jgi:hypothetical protein